MQSTFGVAKAFNIQAKKVAVKKVVTKENSGDYLLKDFVLNSIFLNGEKSLVIIKDPKGGVFLRSLESHLGYKLLEIHMKKAKFKKGVHYYWSFLDPIDEKEFKESEAAPSQGSSGAAVNKMRATVANPMFEEIKFKDGIYYLPKDMLSNKSDMMKHLYSVGARFYNKKGIISFYITYIAPNSVFRKMGIKKGDLIVGANGKGFKSIKEPVEFFQNIKNVKSLSISIKRGNQDKELKYEVY